MKTLRTPLLLLACATASLAFAQWQWVDKDGRKVFSDQAYERSHGPKELFVVDDATHIAMYDVSEYVE